MQYLIAYDVSDDNARAKLAAVLSGWGDRIQKSVFECTISSEEVAGLAERASKFINPDRDSLHIVPVCAACASARIVYGQARVAEPEPFWIV